MERRETTRKALGVAVHPSVLPPSHLHIGWLHLPTMTAGLQEGLQGSNARQEARVFRE